MIHACTFKIHKNFWNNNNFTWFFPRAINAMWLTRTKNFWVVNYFCFREQYFRNKVVAFISFIFLLAQAVAISYIVLAKNSQNMLQFSLRLWNISSQLSFKAVWADNDHIYLNHADKMEFSRATLEHGNPHHVGFGTRPAPSTL